MKQSQDQQKQDCTDRRVDDGGDQPDTQMDAELRHQPGTNEGADNANQDIADDTETCAPHNLAGQPSCDQSNEQYDEKTLT